MIDSSAVFLPDGFSFPFLRFVHVSRSTHGLKSCLHLAHTARFVGIPI